MKLLIIYLIFLAAINSQSFLQVQLDQEDYLEGSNVIDRFQKLDTAFSQMKRNEEFNINIPQDAFEITTKKILCDRISVNGMMAAKVNHYELLKKDFDDISLHSSHDSEERSKFFEGFMNLLKYDKKTKVKDYEYFPPFEFPNGSCDQRNVVFGDKFMDMKNTKAFLSVSISKGLNQSLKTTHEDCKDYSNDGEESNECEWTGHIAPFVFSDDKFYVFDPTVKKMKDGSLTGDAFVDIHEWVKFLIEGDLNTPGRSSSKTFLILITKHSKPSSADFLNRHKMTMMHSYLLKKMRLFWFEGRTVQSTWKSTYCNKEFWKLKSDWLKKLSDKAKIQTSELSKKFGSFFKNKNVQVHPFADNSKPEL